MELKNGSTKLVSNEAKGSAAKDTDNEVSIAYTLISDMAVTPFGF